MQVSYIKKPCRTGTVVARAGRVGDTRRFSNGGLITVGHFIRPYDEHDKAFTTARLSISINGFFSSFLTSTEGRYKDLLVGFSQTVVLNNASVFPSFRVNRLPAALIGCLLLGGGLVTGLGIPLRPTFPNPGHAATAFTGPYAAMRFLSQGQL